VAAPGGDVLGVAWDLNAADQLQFFKYEADTKQWLYTQMPMHLPYYDREWIGVVPGPVTVGGQTYEYVSFVKGGGPSKDVWFYSTDGLNYLAVTSPTLELMLGSAGVRSPLRTVAHPALDWVQPNTTSGMTTLGGGAMLTAPDWLNGVLGVGSYGLLDAKTFSWSPYVFPNGSKPAGSYQVDSAGRLHNVLPTKDTKGFDYRTSRDGGRSWKSVRISLPPSYTMDPPVGNGAFRQQWDFRANLAAGVAAVAVRATNAKGIGQDLVYKLDITGAVPRLSRLLKVGLGDHVAGNGTAESTVARLDFGSVAVFADGRVAVSFLDSTTKHCVCNLRELDQAHLHPNNWEGAAPAIAIEGESAIAGPV